MAGSIPLAPGSYFAELQALQSAKAAGIIDEKTFSCHKQQLNALRKAQEAGVSQILQDIDYKECSSECGCQGRPVIGIELQDLGRESPLTYVPASSAAVRHLMSSPAGFVHVSEGFEGDSPSLRPLKGQSNMGEEDDEEDTIGKLRVLTEEDDGETGSTVMNTVMNTFM